VNGWSPKACENTDQYLSIVIRKAYKHRLCEVYASVSKAWVLL